MLDLKQASLRRQWIQDIPCFKSLFSFNRHIIFSQDHGQPQTTDDTVVVWALRKNHTADQLRARLASGEEMLDNATPLLGWQVVGQEIADFASRRVHAVQVTRKRNRRGVPGVTIS
jgi:hypothetical protein